VHRGRPSRRTVSGKVASYPRSVRRSQRRVADIDSRNGTLGWLSVGLLTSPEVSFPTAAAGSRCESWPKKPNLTLGSLVYGIPSIERPSVEKNLMCRDELKTMWR
jgi:hypothetical protein